MSYISAVKRGDTVFVWERDEDGYRNLVDYPAPYYFYVDDPEGSYKTIYGTPVEKVKFSTGKEYSAAKRKFGSGEVKAWESDIPPEMRVLSNHYYGVKAPKLNITFLDIEVDYDPQRGFSSPQNSYAPINSVALLHYQKNEVVVLAVPPDDTWTVEKLQHDVETISKDAPMPTKYSVRYHLCQNERELLLLLLQEIADSDVLCGWNSDFFDCPYIACRILRVLDGVEVDLSVQEVVDPETGKRTLKYVNDPNAQLNSPGFAKFFRRLDFDHHGRIVFRPVGTALKNKLMGHVIDIDGRIRIDYLNLYKKYEPGERASYKLAAISDIVLVDDDTGEPTLPKLEYEGSLADLYRSNFAFFVRYNIRDTEILGGFEDKLGYVDLANQMVHLSTAQFEHVSGTLKLAEYALVNYCHHTLRRVVNNITRPDVDRAIDGALVLLPQAGLQQKVGSIDIKSLYPSGIRSLNISPETIRGQFENNAKDFLEVAANSNKEITLVLESNKQSYTAPASEWRELFIKRKWAVSGYGTIFDQTKQGFIPALLADWYKQRKYYQGLKKKAESDAASFAKDMSAEGRVAYAKHTQDIGYYDRLQYVYKIKLNSLYGALTNLYFRFYDLRMGESTTGTGRAIVRHQCRKVSEILDGNYNIDFPLYFNVSDAVESGYSVDEAVEISLHGSLINGRWYETKFKGEFQTESLVYGDTDSTYFKTNADTIEDAIKIADAVAEKVNNAYPEFMRNTFLCSEGYDTLIEASREIVSDSGIFVEKKRYILHLVNLDGKPVDKMKVMGLDTKKTTLPSYVAAKLNNFIERFLKGEEWSLVASAVVEYKEELKNSKDITYIGLPKGVNNLEEYTAKFEEDETTRLPGHVAAAIYYNKYIEEIGDKVSQPILSGMKIKQYILSTPVGRFKRIALPTDIEVVPDWFTEMAINRNVHVEKLVDDPLNNILKAIGKEPPTKQSVFIDTFLEF